MAVRILRLLEYVYPDAEAAEKDQARWTLKSPPNNPNRMRSVTLPFETLEFVSPELEVIDGE